MNSLEYTYSVCVSSSQLLNVSCPLKSAQVDMPLSSQVKSSWMCSSRPPSTWNHFSFKSSQVSVPQRLAGLARAQIVNVKFDTSRSTTRRTNEKWIMRLTCHVSMTI